MKKKPRRKPREKINEAGVSPRAYQTIINRFSGETVLGIRRADPGMGGWQAQHPLPFPLKSRNTQNTRNQVSAMDLHGL